LTSLLTWAAPVFAQVEGDAKQPLNPQEGTYRSQRLGIDYQLIPYGGHFGARLVAMPTAGSALRQVVQAGGQAVYLEPGDVITSLDGRLIDAANELEAHYGATTIVFYNARSQREESGTIQLVGNGQNNGATGGESARVRALVIIDTNSQLNGLEADKDRVTSLLRHVGDDRLDLAVFEGARANPDNVIRQIRSWGNAAGDTVFVYYSGHGATDPNRGHALTFTQGGPLFRSRLREELARLNPRLSVILSDCCSNVVELPIGVGAPAADPTATVRSLLLRTQGFVDINGSTYNAAAGVEESAWCLRDGGFFTKAVFETIYFVDLQELDRNNDGLVQWAECLPRIATNLKRQYTEFRATVLDNPQGAKPRVLESLQRQASQTPQAFSLDAGLNQTGGGGRRVLGVNVTPVSVFDVQLNANVLGARIDAVTPGGPAARAGLELGDIITQVNNAGFQSYEEFLQLLAASPERCVLKVRNVRNGQFILSTIAFGG
jgi:membrane-associated protease RseP (regulator of RpoE activity)